ncbi:hypothetical protein AB0F77_18920 [Streptomyces sp. NPDC026672]|uniref:hypothetical protein n=1 Tax=unclassified Streptomyces TaxID=2593676 RepID=UPI0033FD013E
MRRPVRCTAIMMWTGVLLAGVTTSAAATPTGSAPASADRAVRVSTAPVLVDCTWRSTVRPDDFILACGDGNSRLTQLRWSEWGTGSATASGVNMVNDCKPYCAAGTFRSYDVTVRLDRPRSWAKNPQMDHYTRMSLTYASERPEGFTRVMTYPLWE